MAMWTMRTLVDLLRRDVGLPPAEKWESPMEGLFFQEAEPIITGLVCQYPIGSYRVDFAVPDEKIAIEIDGWAFHSTMDQVLKDRQRQREIEGLGWTVIRFTGSEVYEDAGRCARQVKNLIAIRKINRKKPEGN